MMLITGKRVWKQKYEKNSNFAVFEIGNNFIAGIQFLAHRLVKKKLGTPKAPRNTPYLLQKYEKYSNFAVFEFANNFICWNTISSAQTSFKKILNPQSTAEHSQTILICSKNTKKNSNFAVFEIAKNFIVEIQFRARRLATKKLGTLKAPRSTPVTSGSFRWARACGHEPKKHAAKTHSQTQRT